MVEGEGACAGMPSKAILSSEDITNIRNLVHGLLFAVCCLLFSVECSVFIIECLVFSVQCSVFRVSGLAFRIQSLKFLGFRVSGVGVSGFGCRV